MNLKKKFVFGALLGSSFLFIVPYFLAPTLVNNLPLIFAGLILTWMLIFMAFMFGYFFLFIFIAFFMILLNFCFINSFIAFFIFTYLSNRYLNNIKAPWFYRLKERIQEKALIFMLVLRLIPFMPSFLLGMIAGVFKLKFKDFCIAFLISFALKAVLFFSMGKSSVEFNKHFLQDLQIISVNLNKSKPTYFPEYFNIFINFKP